jgi:hypothetical protein
MGLIDVKENLTLFDKSKSKHNICKHLLYKPLCHENPFYTL